MLARYGQQASEVMDRKSSWGWTRMALPLAILLSLFVIYFPLPTPLLDFLLAINLAGSVLLLLAAVMVKSPLELKVFPALLLVSTLLRLSLNVATTRLILGRGAIDKEQAAGQIVSAFSQFVTGESLVVGGLIFAILFIVQFVVITKGATRIGEVAARFALDSLPGRQMAIDADLSAGLINWEEAQRRRQQLISYADFQGAMDGASKYVRGDAVAGLIITAINLIGGLLQGVLQGMSLTESLNVFSLLTIGDGLVSQLPALLISIAAGLLVTRGTEESDLPGESLKQMGGSTAALRLAGGFLLLLPFAGLPWIPLWTLSAGLWWIAALIDRAQAAQADKQLTQTRAVAKETKVERFLETDQIELHLGVDLLPLCDQQRSGTLVADVSGLRSQIASDLGIVLPKVRIRDNLQMASNRFLIFFNGTKVFEGIAETRQLLYVFTRDAFPVQDQRAAVPWAPYAVWGPHDSHDHQAAFQIWTPTQVIVRTLDWLVQEHADQLLTRDATHDLIEEARKSYPRLVGDTIPEIVSVGMLQKAFKQLLREGVALKPLHLILEAVGDNRGELTEVSRVVAVIREALQRHTLQRLAGNDGRLTCFGLSEALIESLEHSKLSGGSDVENFSWPPAVKKNLRLAIQSGINHLMAYGYRPVLCVPHQLRDLIDSVAGDLQPRVMVFSDREVSLSHQVNMIAEITPGDIERSPLVQAA